MAASGLDPAKRARIIELAAAQWARNAIARDVGCSSETVSRIAKAAGFTFDRSASAAGTAARVADARKLRAELAVLLLSDAARLRAQLWQAAHYVDHGGKDFVRADTYLDEPTFADKRNIVQAASTAVTAAAKLDLHDRADETGSDVDTWLDGMTAS